MIAFRLYYRVKLGDKERFDKEQIGVTGKSLSEAIIFASSNQLSMSY